MKRALIAALLATLFAAPLVWAFSSDLSSFNSRYGTRNTMLDDCGLCHGNSTAQLNPYGQDLRDQRAALGNISSALAAVEAWDSDGDTYSNIDALTLNGRDASVVEDATRTSRGTRFATALSGSFSIGVSKFPKSPEKTTAAPSFRSSRRMKQEPRM